MDEQTRQYRSPIQRVGSFLRDFLPEQKLQLLFPLGSLLLLLGTSYSWYRLDLPGVAEVLCIRDHHVDAATFQGFTRSYFVWVQLEELIARAMTQIAFVATLILWTLPSRKIISKFLAWVFFPAGLALVAFETFLISTAAQRNAFTDAFITAVGAVHPTTRSSFPPLAEGVYLAIAGLCLLAVSLALVRQGKISLPVRFRNSRQLTAPQKEGMYRDGRDFFILLVATLVVAASIAWTLAVPSFFGNPHIWNSPSFPVWEWGQALATAIAVCCLALTFLGPTRSEPLQVHKKDARLYLLAIAIPLATAWTPRFVLVNVASFGRWPPSEEVDLFVPHPLPRVLVVYLIALCSEFVLRAYIQTTLEKYVSLKRAIFVTGLFWSLLPLSFGITHSLLGAKNYPKIPGLALLITLTTLIIYSVPLGWLYARTRSVLAVALTNGTIAVFHVGMGYQIHINRPEFYWTELALWIFVGWFLFKKYPIREISPTVAASTSSAS